MYIHENVYLSPVYTYIFNYLNRLNILKFVRTSSEAFLIPHKPQRTELNNLNVALEFSSSTNRLESKGGKKAERKRRKENIRDARGMTIKERKQVL